MRRALAGTEQRQTELAAFSGNAIDRIIGFIGKKTLGFVQKNYLLDVTLNAVGYRLLKVLPAEN